MRYLLRSTFLVPIAAAVAAGASAFPASASPADAALVAAIQSPHRSAKFVARDTARHPAQELAFFGINAGDTVVEIWPGGGYWTEILGPYLQPHGTLYVALPAGDPEETKSTNAFRARLASDPTLFSGIKVTDFGPDHWVVAPPGSADLVLTFRNIHNWMDGGYAPQAFKAFYAALKPGGILGVEEHRGDASKPQDPKAASGYVRQDYAIHLAEAAGFHFVGSSEIDANPKDTKDWPQGVWTLPPSFALGAKDHAKYAAVGEADNFVLKFQK